MITKEEILNGGRDLSVQQLTTYIEEGIVTQAELESADFPKEKIDGIVSERNLRTRVLQCLPTMSPLLIVKYLEEGHLSLNKLQSRGLPESKTAPVFEKLQRKESELWEHLCQKETLEACNRYLMLFANGYHSEEVWKKRERLIDAPWYEAKSINTIESYQDYAIRYPGKHTKEIEYNVALLTEDAKWNDAVAQNTIKGYEAYISEYPEGRYVENAVNAILHLKVEGDKQGKREQILMELRQNPNAYPPFQEDENGIGLQNMIEKGILTVEDLIQLYGHEKASAIINYTKPVALSIVAAADELQPDTTEVYFWGTPSSGKTCALGAIISGAGRKGILEKLPCNGWVYMTQLANIFKAKGICTVPDSTDNSTIQEMILKLTDGKGRQHKVTLIDLAGEVFKGALFQQNNMPTQINVRQTLETTMNYLTDTRNKKMHFFIVEYGAHNQLWEEFTMENYLDSMMSYLRDKQVFDKSTVGVYVLVTKCDKMGGSRTEWPKRANDYVKQELPTFWNTLVNHCKIAGIADLRTVSFSIGEVFAQKLCIFDKSDTEKVTNLLILKTLPEYRGIYGWLRRILKM